MDIKTEVAIGIRMLNARAWEAMRVAGELEKIRQGKTLDADSPAVMQSGIEFCRKIFGSYAGRHNGSGTEDRHARELCAVLAHSLPGNPSVAQNTERTLCSIAANVYAGGVFSGSSLTAREIEIAELFFLEALERLIEACREK